MRNLSALQQRSPNPEYRSFILHAADSVLTNAGDTQTTMNKYGQGLRCAPLRTHKVQVSTPLLLRREYHSK
ncbi:hypothetical protein HDF08_003637 [Edaphobacter lichenicola]|uniref:Uncharacterized protein n=1 Tax=Tunturiibacter lichenicola TaxID=2051959 RepID=A0A852VN99_9BACT|nr:hypothetical protein [Edaphobacter lichenicola]